MHHKMPMPNVPYLTNLVYFQISASCLVWIVWTYSSINGWVLLAALLSGVYLAAIRASFGFMLKGAPLCSPSASNVSVQLNVSTQKVIRLSALLLPIPAILYCLYFGYCILAYDGTSTALKQLHMLAACEESIFGKSQVFSYFVRFGGKPTPNIEVASTADTSPTGVVSPTNGQTIQAAQRSMAAANNGAVRLMHQNNYEAAIAILTQVLKEHPGYKLAIENIAIAYNDAGLSHCHYGTVTSKRPSKNGQKKISPPYEFAAAEQERLLLPFENSLYFHIQNPSRCNYKTVWFMLGIPDTAGAHEAVGDARVHTGQRLSAIVEYETAIALGAGSTVKDKLASLSEPLPRLSQLGGPADSAVNDDEIRAGTDNWRKYIGQVQAKIKKCWRPATADNCSQAIYTFHISRDGSVEEIKTLRSSRSKSVDGSEIEAIKGASPFEPLSDPEGVDVEFTFDLQ